MKQYRLLVTGMFMLVVAIFWQPSTIFGMERPTTAQLEQYKQDGTLDQKIKTAKRIGNDKPSGVLIDNMRKNISRLNSGQGLQPVPIDPKGFPTTGSPKTLVILVDFPDMPHTDSQTVEEVDTKIFGPENVNDPHYPLESLSAYYSRSSYGKLNIQGDVLGWYTAQHDRSYYEQLSQYNGEANAVPDGQEALIQEVFNYYDDQVNFADYDNDGDGVLDNIFIKWTGDPSTYEWASFWWAYQWGAYNTVEADGVQLNTFIWSWYEETDGAGFDPLTDIHEVGHVLGLEDYYDYDPNVGVDGALGGLDIMDGLLGDHNAFSKFLLGWITPKMVTSGSKTYTLSPSSKVGDAVIVMPNVQSNDPYQQFFIAEYRNNTIKNDSGPQHLPASGMLIWHIDATLNANAQYKFNNSYTSHKLIRLMEADGLEEIETKSGSADAGDFYTQGDVLSPTSTPNSRAYNGGNTKITVSNFSSAGTTMSANFTIGNLLVTYNSKGGSAVPSKSTLFGSLLTMPTSTKAGYTLVGWYKDEALKTSWKFNSDLASDDMTLYAKWVANPSVPSNVGTTIASSNGITINWSAVSGATGYEVYRATSEAGTYSLVATVTSGVSTTNSGLTMGQNYYYKLRSYKLVDGVKVYSNFTTVVSAQATPPAPTTMVATKASASSVKLTWGTVSGTTGYEVYRSTSSGGTYSLLKSSTSNSYTDTSLTKNVTYYYKVRAFKLVGNTKIYSGWTTISSIKM